MIRQLEVEATEMLKGVKEERPESSVTWMMFSGSVMNFLDHRVLGEDVLEDFVG